MRPTGSQPFGSRDSPLLTDLYQLTMGASYFAKGKKEPATFSLFIREPPLSKRNFYVAAGLDLALQSLCNLRFSDNEVAYLESTDLFKNDFLTYLKNFRFSGDAVALSEGTLCFADEPLLEVTAPIIEAQLMETLLMNLIGFQTMIATKAARCVHAAQNRGVIDFGLRRAQGRDAGMLAARAAYLAGFSATSNVLAGKTWQIPVSGTMAHSYVTAFENEEAAFTAFAREFGSKSVFLIDTYDTLEGARVAAKVANRMRNEGRPLLGVRLDSGNMVSLSRKVRKILDNAGCPAVKIFASSGFDEFKIREVVAQKAAIDAFGVGNKVVVSADEPYLNIVYKMVHYGERPVRKNSPGKRTLAGKKQVFRRFNREGHIVRDIIGVRNETADDARALLTPVMRKGAWISGRPDLEKSRSRFKTEFSLLPNQYKALERLPPDKRFPVAISASLAKQQC